LIEPTFACAQLDHRYTTIVTQDASATALMNYDLAAAAAASAAAFSAAAPTM
jgi:hypothetical protein